MISTWRASCSAEEPVEVTALGSALVDKAIGEPAMSTASRRHPEDGDPASIAIISNSRRATYGYDQRIEVHGSKGMVFGRPNQRARLDRACRSPTARAIPARRCMISS
jgi:predicted dehydrogenase